MEKQRDISFLEIILTAASSCLSHKRLFSLIVLIPTAVMFVMVMWGFTPEYRAEAVFTSPVENSAMVPGMGVGKKLGEKGNSLSDLFSDTDEGADVTMTFAKSWELHERIIEKFDLARDYKFKGKFYADLLKKFRKNLKIEMNDEDMFHVTFDHKDYKKAAAVVQYFLTQVDSMYNYYKTNQARQMREYMDARIKEVEKEMESMKKDFIKFQRKNNYYDPDRQLESTIRYMANMQTEREAIKQEISYELAKQGTRTKRVEDLERRLKNLESAISQVTDGKQSDMGVVALNKTPELSNQYLKLKSELQMQQAIYVMLREQREQLDMEANNKQVNLIVLQPPWENDKRVFPKRGLMMMFTFFISFLVATLLCSFIEYMRSESKKGSEISYEWESIVREICFWRK